MKKNHFMRAAVLLLALTIASGSLMLARAKYAEYNIVGYGNWGAKLKKITYTGTDGATFTTGTAALPAGYWGYVVRGENGQNAGTLGGSGGTVQGYFYFDGSYAIAINQGVGNGNEVGTENNVFGRGGDGGGYCGIFNGTTIAHNASLVIAGGGGGGVGTVGYKENENKDDVNSIANVNFKGGNGADILTGTGSVAGQDGQRSAGFGDLQVCGKGGGTTAGGAHGWALSISALGHFSGGDAANGSALQGGHANNGNIKAERRRYNQCGGGGGGYYGGGAGATGGSASNRNQSGGGGGGGSSYNNGLSFGDLSDALKTYITTGAPTGPCVYLVYLGTTV